MKRIFSVIVFLVACGGGGGGGDGKSSDALGVNASVPQTCQMCLATSTGNECAQLQKDCSGDKECQALNKCVNACANINDACIQSCGDAVSQTAIDEWNSWWSCTCDTCATQCNQTFCNIGNGSNGSNGSNSCIPDNNSCSTNEDCCTFCASDGVCGCVPTNDQCQTDSDCCSGACDGGGCD
jgi:hypothetical protein